MNTIYLKCMAFPKNPGNGSLLRELGIVTLGVVHYYLQGSLGKAVRFKYKVWM